MEKKIPPKPSRPVPPKSEEGLSRSAQALRANLAKRKAQARARTENEPESKSKPVDNSQVG